MVGIADILDFSFFFGRELVESIDELTDTVGRASIFDEWNELVDVVAIGRRDGDLDALDFQHIDSA